MSKLPGAVSFYHDNGFVSAFNQAREFAGDGGRVGTMLDVVKARLLCPPYHQLDCSDFSNPTPWDHYYTTMTAEYFGLLGGRKTIIVAHGVGPMSTRQGVLDAYRYHYGDKTGNCRGGRISQQEFDKLASGAYGPVFVIDYEKYQDRFGDRQFRAPTGYRRVGEAFIDPLLTARLGPQSHDYIMRHASYAKEYSRKEAGRDVESPFILEVGEPNQPYWCRELEPGLALAHLVSIGGIRLTYVQNGEKRSNGLSLPSWLCDVGIHDWNNGVRLLGVRSGWTGETKQGPDARLLLRDHWQKLLEPTGLKAMPHGHFALMQMSDGTWFTQVPKKGASADTHEPEFRVTALEKVGPISRFSTSSNYPVPIFRFDIREALSVLPREANAYVLVGNPERDNEHTDSCCIQGYKVEIDHTQRLIRQDVLKNDLAKMMSLYEPA